MPVVSIIIPVYNAGAHLIPCLDSLVSQTFKELEMVIVLDCPTDGSDKICEEYAKRDNRIKIVRNTTNLHIGFSRDMGLEKATGEYVGFSDDDDYRELDMYEKLYSKAKESDADMVVGVTVNETDGKKQVFNYPKVRDEDFREFALADLIGCGGWRDNYPLCINVHPHLYRRSFLEKNDIRFADTRKTAPEDRLFNISCLLQARKVAYEPRPMYYHRILPDSFGNSSQYLRADRFMNYIDEVYRLLCENNSYELYKPWFYIGAGRNMMGMAIGILQSTHSISTLNRLLRKMSERQYCSEVFCHYVPQQHLLRYKLLERYIKNVLSK